MGQWLYGMAVSKQHIHTVNASTHAFIAVNNFLPSIMGLGALVKLRVSFLACSCVKAGFYRASGGGCFISVRNETRDR